METAREVIRGYARTKNRWWVLLVLAYCTLLTIKLFGIRPNNETSFWLLPMSLLYFGIHETAHAFTMGLPSVVTAAAGSLSEIAFGLLLIGVAIRLRSYVFMAYAGLWLAYASIDAGIYMADAIPQNLTLFSPFGDNAVHDWHYVFSALHILGISKLIGNAMSALGYVYAVASLGLLAYMLAWSWRHKASPLAQETTATARASSGFVGVPPAPVGAPAKKPLATDMYPSATRGTLASQDTDTNEAPPSKKVSS